MDPSHESVEGASEDYSVSFNDNTVFLIQRQKLPLRLSFHFIYFIVFMQ